MRNEDKRIKIIQFCVIAGFLFFPVFCRAADLESLKADFLQGNYRRVIFEGEAARPDIRASDELNYILGLSYLKENNLTRAREEFNRILKNPSSKFKAQAAMSLADTYLISGEYREAEDIYNKLINEEPNTSLKAALLYRLSQAALKKGDHRLANDHLLKLKRDFPLSPELKSTRGFPHIEAPRKDSGVYSVQVGFFANTANADNLRDKLCVLGFSAYVEEAQGGYRVRVGRFKALGEALDMESELSKKGFPTKVCP
ncbi:MAG: SPOR domain-containing protein [Candidatus Omnitrophica bacterium]|nr:SPOR domain-containing protein [Candidatus Omnitrophota bacterium]